MGFELFLRLVPPRLCDLRACVPGTAEHGEDLHHRTHAHLHLKPHLYLNLSTYKVCTHYIYIYIMVWYIYIYIYIIPYIYICNMVIFYICACIHCRKPQEIFESLWAHLLSRPSGLAYAALYPQVCVPYGIETLLWKTAAVRKPH